MFVLAYRESCANVEKAIALLNPDGYAYILHDLDTLDTGELKKEHYHIYLEFENQREFSHVAEYFGIAENLVEKVKNTKACIRYLAHVDSKEKFQYDRANIVSHNLDIEKFFSDYTESDRVAQVIQIIYDFRELENSTFGQVVMECASRGLWDVLRRGNSIFLEIWRNG